LIVTRSEILAVVKTNIYKIVEEAQSIEIREEMSMRDLGADSLQIVEVVSRSMKELRLKVPRTDLMKAKNINDLIDLFERAQINPTRS
jgi:acyl carrier protein